MFEVIQIALVATMGICFLLTLAYVSIGIIADITDNYEEDSILEKILFGLIKFNHFLFIVPIISMLIILGYCLVELWNSI